MEIPNLDDLSRLLLRNVMPLDNFVNSYKACFLELEAEIAALPDHAAEPEEITEARKRMAWVMRCMIDKVRDDRWKMMKLFELHEECPIDLE
jgi:hypothetical protein